MKLDYDNVTRTTNNSPGVETRIPGFGTIEVLEYLDPDYVKDYFYFFEHIFKNFPFFSQSTGEYALPITDALVENGYVRDVSLRGAPYDFRKAPSKLGRF